MNRFSVAVLSLMALNCALVTGGIGVSVSNSGRLKTGELDRIELRKEILKNREETLTNRKKGDVILEALKRMEQKP